MDSRWYILTPGKLVGGLLGIELCLLGIGRHSGCLCLAGVALVFFGLLAGVVWFAIALLVRRQFQFSIRTLLMLMVLVAIVAGWFFPKRERARRQKEAVVAVESVSGLVYYRPESQPVLGETLVGVDFLSDVVAVEANVATLPTLTDLTDRSEFGEYYNGRLWTVTDPSFCTGISDAQLKYLAKLPTLEMLHLERTQITDAGLEYLRGLTNITDLSFADTRITDVGLVHLNRLTALRALNLTNTQVTGVAFEHLTDLTNLKELDLTSTQITDAGLEHLARLANLTWLRLTDTPITDAGLEHLETATALERLWLDGTKVTDAGLKHLKGLTRLRELCLIDTWVTKEGAKDARRALPHCAIARWGSERWTSLYHTGPPHRCAGLEGEQVTDNDIVFPLPTLEGTIELSWVNLQGSPVTDDGLENLKGLTRLKLLNLCATQITDAGLEHLRGLAQLQTLDLQCTRITDAALQRLKAFIHLRRLYVYGTEATDEGIKNLQQALPHCTIRRRMTWHPYSEGIWVCPEYRDAFMSRANGYVVGPRKAFFNRGCAYVKSRQYDAAIADFTECVRLDPEDVGALVWRGYAYSRVGQYSAAIADYTNVVRLHPHNVEALSYRGHAYSDLGRYDAAIADYTEVVRLDPKYVGALWNRGLIYNDLGEYDKASKDLDEAVRLNPNDAATNSGLAWVLATCPDEEYRDGKRSIELAKKACELSDWKNAGEICTLAAAFAEVGDFIEAVKWQEKAQSMYSRKEAARWEFLLDRYKSGKRYREEPKKHSVKDASQ
jgi:tetratricopeptide (TPR) repeat protein